MPAVRSLWRVVEKQMTRDRDTGGREVLPGVQGNREAHGAVFDGLWNEVIVRTEAWAKERNRPLLKGLVEARVVSGVVLALGLALLVPLVLSLLYRDGSWASFLLPGAAMALIGGVGLRVTSSLFRTPRYVSNRDVYLSVTLAWVVAALLGGVPFLIEGTFDSLLDSTFEAMSGFTTTGGPRYSRTSRPRCLPSSSGAA